MGYLKTYIPLLAGLLCLTAPKMSAQIYDAKYATQDFSEISEQKDNRGRVIHKLQNYYQDGVLRHIYEWTYDSATLRLQTYTKHSPEKAFTESTEYRYNPQTRIDTIIETNYYQGQLFDFTKTLQPPDETTSSADPALQLLIEVLRARGDETAAIYLNSTYHLNKLFSGELVTHSYDRLNDNTENASFTDATGNAVLSVYLYKKRGMELIFIDDAEDGLFKNIKQQFASSPQEADQRFDAAHRSYGYSISPPSLQELGIIK